MIKIITGLLLITIGLLTPLGEIVANDSIAVIVNSKNRQPLSRQQLKNIYLGIVSYWKNGETIEVYNLPVKAPARFLFSNQILGMSPQAAKAREINRKLTNSAKNPFKTKSERLISVIVSKKRNAIGYIGKKIAKTKRGIRIVLTLDKE